IPGTCNDDPAGINDDGGAKKPVFDKPVSGSSGQLIDVVGSNGSGHYDLLTLGLSPVDSPGGNTSGNHTDSQRNYCWNKISSGCTHKGSKANPTDKSGPQRDQ